MNGNLQATDGLSEKPGGSRGGDSRLSDDGGPDGWKSARRRWRKETVGDARRKMARGEEDCQLSDDRGPMDGNLQGDGDGRTVGGAWRKMEENEVATPLSRNTMEAFARRKGLLTVGHV